MKLLIGAVVIAFLVILLVGAVTGRVRARNCCAPADPRLDKRMRDAYTDDARGR